MKERNVAAQVFRYLVSAVHFRSGFEFRNRRLVRLFAGFAIAVVLGVSIGIAAAANPAINAVVRPIVRVLAPLPKVALYPALLLLLGPTPGLMVNVFFYAPLLLWLWKAPYGPRYRSADALGEQMHDLTATDRWPHTAKSGHSGCRQVIFTRRTPISKEVGLSC